MNSIIPARAEHSGNARFGTPHTSNIPIFALYGEAGAPRQELLHVEEVQSRSRLYHWEIKPHMHHGMYQVLWIAHGHAEVLLDEQQQRVEGPAAIVIPPGVVHGFRFAPELDGLVLSFSAHFLVEGDFHSVGLAFQNLFSAAGILRFAPAPDTAGHIQTLFRALLGEFELPASAASPVSGWLARTLVWKLAQAHAQFGQTPSDSSRRHHALFTRFTLLVEAHFLEHWPISRYARDLGLSAPRLNRLARQACGSSALELVHERLTREACRRLTYVAAPAASLAAELGFNDPAYFSRFFKKRTGLSPQQWRATRLASHQITQQN